MPAPIDLSGQRFGRWTVVRRSHGHSYWLCVCDCGTERRVQSPNIVSGRSTSCGCARTEMMVRRSTTHGYAGRNSHVPEYKSWLGMRERCRNPRNAKYHRYGGRGIRICARWSTFENFFADMGQKPSRAHSIDRINNDGHYEPGNCRWATPKEQANNTSHTARRTGT